MYSMSQATQGMGVGGGMSHMEGVGGGQPLFYPNMTHMAGAPATVQMGRQGLMPSSQAGFPMAPSAMAMPMQDEIRTIFMTGKLLPLGVCVNWPVKLLRSLPKC